MNFLKEKVNQLEKSAHIRYESQQEEQQMFQNLIKSYINSIKSSMG